MKCGQGMCFMNLLMQIYFESIYVHCMKRKLTLSLFEDDCDDSFRL